MAAWRRPRPRPCCCDRRVDGHAPELHRSCPGGPAWPRCRTSPSRSGCRRDRAHRGGTCRVGCPRDSRRRSRACQPAAPAGAGRRSRELDDRHARRYAPRPVRGRWWAIGWAIRRRATGEAGWTLSVSRDAPDPVGDRAASSGSWVTWTAGDAELLEEVAHLDGQAVVQVAVERAQRLVEQEQARLGREGAGQRHPLRLAPGQRGHLAALVAGQADQREQLGHPRVDLGAWPALHPQAEADVAARRRGAGTAGCPGTSARSRRWWGGTPARSSPSHATRPASGRSSPAITRSRVVLPPPLGPCTATISPSATARSTPVEHRPRRPKRTDARPRQTDRASRPPPQKPARSAWRRSTARMTTAVTTIRIAASA